MTPRTDASLRAHLAPSVSCSSSGCQTSSWNAVSCGFKTKFDHDHLHHDRGTEMSQNCPKRELLHLLDEESCVKVEKYIQLIRVHRSEELIVFEAVKSFFRKEMVLYY